MGGFEQWARDEIARLRGEADHLDRTLTRYLASRGRSGAPSAPDPVPMRPTVSSATGFAPARRRSKNEAILIAIDAAGPNGLSLDEMEQAAQRAGINSNRNVLRSFCWTEKNAGRLFQPSIGRYASSRFLRDEAATPTAYGGGIAASVLDHNQHREGDAGGGI